MKTNVQINAQDLLDDLQQQLTNKTMEAAILRAENKSLIQAIEQLEAELDQPDEGESNG